MNEKNRVIELLLKARDNCEDALNAKDSAVVWVRLAKVWVEEAIEEIEKETPKAEYTSIGKAIVRFVDRIQFENSNVQAPGLKTSMVGLDELEEVIDEARERQVITVYRLRLEQDGNWMVCDKVNKMMEMLKEETIYLDDYGDRFEEEDIKTTRRVIEDDRPIREWLKNAKPGDKKTFGLFELSVEKMTKQEWDRTPEEYGGWFSSRKARSETVGLRKLRRGIP